MTDAANGPFVGLSIIPLIRAKVTTACAMSGSDCTDVAALKTNIMNNLDKRFPMNEFVTIATLLDPASKNKKFLNMSLEEKRNLLLAAIREASSGGLVTASTSVANLQNESAENSCEPLPVIPSKRLRIMDEFEDEESDSDVVAMVTKYLSSSEKPTEAERADPLLFWKNSNCMELASVARIYLSASASSVPCESMFSVAGLMLNGRRSSLAPHNFNRLIFIHDNAKLMLC